MLCTAIPLHFVTALLFNLSPLRLLAAESISFAVQRQLPNDPPNPWGGLQLVFF